MNMGQNANNDQVQSVDYDPDELDFVTSNFLLHPDGKFKAKVTGLKMREKAYGSQPAKKEIGLVFTTDYVHESTGQNATITKFGSPSVGARAFVGKYLVAIGEDLSEIAQKVTGGSFNMKDYINKACSINVIHEDLKDGSGKYHKIAAVGPPEKKKAATPATPATPRPNFDDEDDAE